jgi:uncharacterized protein (TIGR00304 family)
MSLIKSGIFLILIGFALVFIGTLLSAQNAAFGGLIMIGPIPIAFGSSPGITVIAMAIGLLLMLIFFILRRRNMRSAEESALVDKSIPHNEIKEGGVKGGGVILIGPIPIVFGTDKRYALILMVLAIVLMLLAIVFLK